MRYLRTTKAHHVKSGAAVMTIAILLLGYFPVHTLRLLYDGENNRFTTAKLRATVRAERAPAPVASRLVVSGTGGLSTAQPQWPPAA
jgi:hypothetical protein